MNRRLEGFRQRMQGVGVQAALVTFPPNIRYLTGYKGEGALLALPGEAVILTDFRYVEQAAREAPDCLCVRTTTEEKLPQKVYGLLEERGIRSLHIEPEALTFSEYRRLEKALEGVSLEELPKFCEEMRMVKDEHELACVIRASEIACRAFDRLLGIIKPGVTEKALAVELNYMMLREGSEACAFDTIVAAGVNGSLPHAVPSGYRIQKGDMVTFDFGAQVDGYKTDITRTVAVGVLDEAKKAIYQTVLDAQRAALEKIEPGVICRDVDKVARDLIDAKYPGAFGHSLGHGVGLCIHELPNFSVKCESVLQAGHVMTVEPGVYIEGLGGCRIEDTVILRPGGFVNAITAPKELICL